MLECFSLNPSLGFNLINNIYSILLWNNSSKKEYVVVALIPATGDHEIKSNGLEKYV
jgi:hypothetical protein